MPHLQPSFPEMDNRSKATVPYLHGREEMKLPYPGNASFQSHCLIVLWVAGKDTCEIFFLSVSTFFSCVNFEMF